MKQDIAYGILKTGRNVFLTGSAGTGKTFLLNKYIDYLKARGDKTFYCCTDRYCCLPHWGNDYSFLFGIGIQEYHDKYAIDRLYKRILYKRMKDVKV